MMPEAEYRDASAVREAVVSRRATAREVVQESLKSIERHNSLGLCTETFGDAAMDVAGRLDGLIDRGEPVGPLAGVPIGVKANFDVWGSPTDAATRVLEKAPPAKRDARLVTLLRAAGAIVVCKTNMDEVAFGDSSSNELHGPSYSPWTPGSSPGGSSGGSAGAVSAGMVAMATGSDTAGSIRNPAARCGVVGYKPTYGLFPTEGTLPLALSLDTAGMLAASVRDCSVVHSLVVGRGPHRAQESPSPRIGVVSPLIERSDKYVRAGVVGALEQLKGATSSISLPGGEDVAPAIMTILFAEGSAAWDPVAERAPMNAGEALSLLLAVGRRISAQDYLTAERVRVRLREEVATLFAAQDLLIMPVSALAPDSADGAEGPLNPESPLIHDKVKFTALWSLTGCPVVVVPCHQTRGRPPVSVQLVAAPGDDARLLGWAAHLEGLWASNLQADGGRHMLSRGLPRGLGSTRPRTMTAFDRRNA